MLAVMCASHKWQTLRLDGSCSVKQRQVLVDIFNDPKVRARRGDTGVRASVHSIHARPEARAQSLMQWCCVPAFCLRHRSTQALCCCCHPRLEALA